MKYFLIILKKKIVEMPIWIVYSLGEKLLHLLMSLIISVTKATTLPSWGRCCAWKLKGSRCHPSSSGYGKMNKDANVLTRFCCKNLPLTACEKKWNLLLTTAWSLHHSWRNLQPFLAWNRNIFHLRLSDTRNRYTIGKLPVYDTKCGN